MTAEHVAMFDPDTPATVLSEFILILTPFPTTLTLTRRRKEDEDGREDDDDDDRQRRPQQRTAKNERRPTTDDRRPTMQQRMTKSVNKRLLLNALFPIIDTLSKHRYALPWTTSVSDITALNHWKCWLRKVTSRAVAGYGEYPFMGRQRARWLLVGHNERRTANDERRTTNDERRRRPAKRRQRWPHRTTDDGRRTTDDGRRTE